MKAHVSKQLRDLVIIRANDCCEYCRLHAEDEPVYAHEIDHVIPENMAAKLRIVISPMRVSIAIALKVRILPRSIR